MRHRLSFVAALAGLCSCADPGSQSGPPVTQLYFPTSIAHVDTAKDEGVLFVSNANFDKRYATGSVVALNLDAIGLPKLGTTTGTVEELKDLKLTDTQSVQIASFAGEMAVQNLAANDYRLFVPTRSEGNRVYRVHATVDAQGVPTLGCVGAEGQNCIDTGASLSPREFEQSTTGVPRAPGPYGVALGPRTCSVDADCCGADEPDCGRTCSAAGTCNGLDGTAFNDVWVTHISQADSPALSNLNFRGYLVRLDSDAFSVGERNFINIGSGGSNSATVFQGWTYVSGRILSPAPNLMRVVNRDGVTLSTALEYLFRVSDSRGIAVSSDGKRLYMVGRIPDVLLVMGISNAATYPTLSFIRAVPLPDAPNALSVLSRPGKGDLVFVTCTSGGSVVTYDDGVGDLVSTVGGVGVQPFSIAVDQRGNAARLFVSLFGDGRIAVIDVPDLDHPQRASLVAHLGSQQLCLTRGVNSPGCIASQEVP
ncbi:MAG: hypothetical protein U0228_19345 [Myxococcaceae bacterium]